MSGALATSIEPSGMDAEGSDGCSIFGLTSVPSVPWFIDGTSDAVESAEDIPSEQREGSQKRSIDTTAIGDVVPSESLSISDRALLHRFGQVKSLQRSTDCIEGSSSVSSASGSRVDGHPLNLSLNIFDRALLRRFPDVPPTLSSTSGTAAVIPSPPRRVTGETSKKRKRFIGKGNTKKSITSPESLESLQFQLQFHQASHFCITYL